MRQITETIYKIHYQNQVSINCAPLALNMLNVFVKELHREREHSMPL